MSIDYHVLRALEIKAATLVAEAGFVTWHALPPAATSWADHKEALIDAYYTALTFSGGQGFDEWLVLGKVAACFTRSCRHFEHAQRAIKCPPYVFIGMIGLTLVYIDISLNEQWFGGVGDLCARGLIVDSPVTYG